MKNPRPWSRRHLTRMITNLHHKHHRFKAKICLIISTQQQSKVHRQQRGGLDGRCLGPYDDEFFSRRQRRASVVWDWVGGIGRAAPPEARTDVGAALASDRGTLHRFPKRSPRWTLSWCCGGEGSPARGAVATSVAGPPRGVRLGDRKNVGDDPRRALRCRGFR